MSDSKEVEVVYTDQLLRLIRDARSTRKAERELLMALALRADTKKKFLCWPSYAKLEKDTLLSSLTLKRAARSLEKKGLIRRVGRMNAANRWFINVPKLMAQAAAQKAADAHAKEAARAAAAEAEDEFTPFPDEVANVHGYDDDTYTGDDTIPAPDDLDDDFNGSDDFDGGAR